MCILQRNANNTALTKYITGSVSFWMNSPFTLLYLNKELNISKLKNPDIKCVQCSKPEDDRCKTTGEIKDVPSDWIIKPLPKKIDCQINLSHKNASHQFHITTSPVSKNLHKLDYMKTLTFRLYTTSIQAVMIPSRISIHCKQKTSLTLLHSHLQIKLTLDATQQKFQNLEARSIIFHQNPQLEYHDKTREQKEKQVVWSCNHDKSHRTIQKNVEQLKGQLFVMKTEVLQTDGYLLNQKENQILDLIEISIVMHTIIQARHRYVGYDDCSKSCTQFCSRGPGAPYDMCIKARSVTRGRTSAERYYKEDITLNYESEGRQYYNPLRGYNIPRMTEIYGVLYPWFRYEGIVYMIILDEKTRIHVEGILIGTKKKPIKMVRTIKQTKLLEKSISKIFEHHRIFLSSKEASHLANIWYQKLVQGDNMPRCQNLLEIRKDDLLFRGFHHKNIVSSYRSCTDPSKRVPHSFPSIAQYHIVNNHKLVIIPISKINPEKEYRFLNALPQRFPTYLYQGSLVSINHQMGVVYLRVRSLESGDIFRSYPTS